MRFIIYFKYFIVLATKDCLSIYYDCTISNENRKTFLAKLLVATDNMKFEAAADLLTWKNGEVEENIILEFARQYEKLNDEEKSELFETAKSAHDKYVQEMMKRVREPGKPRIRIEMSHKDNRRLYSSSSSINTPLMTNYYHHL